MGLVVYLLYFKKKFKPLLLGGIVSKNTLN